MSGAGQVLANALLEVEYALPLIQKNPEVAQAGLNALRQELRDGLAELKEYVAELQPPLLQEMGLGPSIQQYVHTFGERTGIRAECGGCEQFHERYPSTIEVSLFRILQEALTNVVTHAKATEVSVQLERQSNQIQVVVEDNGRGFTVQGTALPKKRQLGIIAMRDRAELLGGQMQLFSEAGRGVRVVVTIPYHGHLADQVISGGPEAHERTSDVKPRPRDANNHSVKGHAHKRKSSASQPPENGSQAGTPQNHAPRKRA
jgi:two-component system sensor histidine kinase DegS